MAIGFEFATSWNVYRKESPVFGPTIYAKFPKATVLYAKPGWQITVDGSEIEFVLDPVDDARGEMGIQQRLDDFIRGVRMLAVLILRSTSQNKHSINHVRELQGRPVPIKGQNLVALLGPSLTPTRDFYIVCKDPNSPLADLQALPQASVGIRLGRIRKFWRALGQESGSRAAVQFGTQSSASTLQSAALNHSLLVDTHWPSLEGNARAGHKPSAKLRGLITLIATYLIKGKSPVEGRALPTKVVKNLMLIMSRTSFAALFDQLPLAEQAYYRANPTHWVNFICREVMGKVDSGKDYNPEGNLIELVINDYGELEGDNRILLPITRKAWLTQMLQHVDLLSAQAHPIGLLSRENRRLYQDVAGLGHRLRGLAGLGNRMDTIVYRGRPEKAAIFELRSVNAEKIRFSDWTSYAIRVFRFVHAINVGRRHEAVILED